MFNDLPEGQTHSYNDGCDDATHNSCNHEIGRNSITQGKVNHPTGVQLCLLCGKTLNDIIKEARAKGYEEGKKQCVRAVELILGKYEGLIIGNNIRKAVHDLSRRGAEEPNIKI